MARNKNSVPMYENEFIGSSSTKTIKIGEKVFKVRNKSKITIAAARLYREYMSLTKKISSLAGDVDVEEIKDMEVNQDNLEELDETFEMVTNVFDYMADMSEIAWKILTLLLGEEAMDYIDELEYTEEDVLKLMQMVYDIARGQYKKEDTQSEGNQAGGDFR